MSELLPGHGSLLSTEPVSYTEKTGYQTPFQCFGPPDLALPFVSSFVRLFGEAQRFILAGQDWYVFCVWFVSRCLYLKLFCPEYYGRTYFIFAMCYVFRLQKLFQKKK